MRSMRWRSLIVVLALLATVACLLPNVPGLPSSVASRLPSTAVKLGLDLRGGINLTLGVDVDKALSNSLLLLGQDLRSQAAAAGLLLTSLRPGASGALELTLPDAGRADALDSLLAESFGQLAVSSTAELPSGGLRYTLTWKPEQRAALAARILDQSVRTLRNRIDQFGVAEPDIRKQGGDRIQIQLPGLSDPERAVQLLGQTAELTFHRVRTDVPAGGVLPVGTAWHPLKNGGGLVLDVQPLMTGQDVADARPAFDENGQAYVALQFNGRGGALFERVTGELLRQPLAIVLDGTVESAPVVRQQISGGRASISGRFTTAEAQDLAIALRAGSLPAPVTVLEERTVGPSLGLESIHSGLLAGVAGALAVMGLMQMVYGRSGAVANVMLAFTVGLLFAGLGALGATLTLPGIAGVVLTIGMSVDANVLIFERIREERKQGISPARAVSRGFERASISITDSNLTTIIAAAILYQFGTGPVRGFAVTLTLGVAASMFTAVFVSRLLFEWWTRRAPSPRSGPELRAFQTAGRQETPLTSGAARVGRPRRAPRGI